MNNLQSKTFEVVKLLTEMGLYREALIVCLDHWTNVMRYISKNLNGQSEGDFESIYKQILPLVRKQDEKNKKIIGFMAMSKFMQRQISHGLRIPESYIKSYLDEFGREFRRFVHLFAD